MKYKMLAVMALLLSIRAHAQKPPDWNETEDIRAILTYAGNDADLPIGLAHCVAYTESRFIPTARSKLVDNYRSCGIMQLYRKYIVAMVGKYSSHPAEFDWKDPADNAEVGCRYLAYLIKRFDGSVYLGVLSFNWGETSVQNMRSLDEVPPKCKRYADSILKLLDSYDESW